MLPITTRENRVIRTRCIKVFSILKEVERREELGNFLMNGEY